MKKENIRLIICIVLLVIFDQIIKLLATNFLINNDIVIIDNFFKFSYLTNEGAALGVLSGNLILLLSISIFLIWYLIKEMKSTTNKLYLVALSLVLSGALGNLIDRIFRGYVIDYISFTLFNREMPIFNLADILITFGIIIVIYVVIKGGNNDNKSE